MSAALQQVHLRITDAATGQPTPCRIRCTGPDGAYYAPFGRLTDLGYSWTADCAGNLRCSDDHWAYIDGACEIRLPVGQITIKIARGLEYKPAEEQINLVPGKLSLRFTLERWIDLRQQGWYAGELGAHCLTPHGALLEGAGEDLAVVNLLAYLHPTALPGAPVLASVETPNLLAFSGQQSCLSLPGHLVVVNTRNHHPVLGRLELLNCHRVVYPLAFGGLLGPDDWTLADWCDQCHRKDGLVAWTDLADWSPDSDRAGDECLANALCGRVDAVALNLQRPEGWYALLNCGLRLPLLCGHDRTCPMVRLGQVRTYARLQPGEEFTYKNWIEAVRKGRTFVTMDPLLSCELNGVGPGGAVALDQTGQEVRVHATARSLWGHEEMQVLLNGEVIASGQREIDQSVPISASGWVAVRCGRGDQILAHSSPIYVTVAGQPPTAQAGTVESLVQQIDRAARWVDQEARCPDDAARARLQRIFDKARAVLFNLLVTAH